MLKDLILRIQRSNKLLPLRLPLTLVAHLWYVVACLHPWKKELTNLISQGSYSLIIKPLSTITFCPGISRESRRSKLSCVICLADVVWRLSRISCKDVCHSSCGNDLSENFYCGVMFIITVSLFIALNNGRCFTEQFLYSPKLLSGLEMVKSNLQV